MEWKDAAVTLGIGRILAEDRADRLGVPLKFFVGESGEDGIPG